MEIVEKDGAIENNDISILNLKVELKGFEPSTSALRTLRSPN